MVKRSYLTELNSTMKEESKERYGLLAETNKPHRVLEGTSDLSHI